MRIITESPSLCDRGIRIENRIVHKRVVRIDQMYIGRVGRGEGDLEKVPLPIFSITTSFEAVIRH
jgi:hypothetical protein